MQQYILNQGTSNPGVAGFRGNTHQKLPVVNWLADLPETQQESDLVEVQFKNTRKCYYLNSNGLLLEKGDWVAVEASPGHDVGVVTLTGRLVLLQIKKNRINMDRYEVKPFGRKYQRPAADQSQRQTSPFSLRGKHKSKKIHHDSFRPRRGSRCEHDLFMSVKTAKLFQT